MDFKKIIIAEDHPIVAKSIKQLMLQIDKTLQIYTVNSCEELMNMAVKIIPDACLVDMYLSDGISISVVENLMSLYPETNVMIYTTFPGKVYVKKLFQMGIHGFLNKSSSEEELTLALRKLLNGEFYVCSEYLPLLVNSSNKKHDEESNPFSLLSGKELQIVEYLCRGLSLKDIADKMSIKQNTAATYKKRAFEKLNVSNVLELNEAYKHYTGKHAE